MAKIRINPLSSKEKDFPHKDDESLQQIFDRFFSSLRNQDEKLKEYYIILLAGKEIPKDLWKTTTPNGNTVLIAVTLKGGGDNRGLLRQGLILASITVATVLTSGMAAAGGGSAWAAAGIVTATSIAATLTFNALIPPVDAGGLGSLGSMGYNPASSQMYAISGQSNKQNKFGTVPKVYGRTKMFPNIAATPYTEITTNSDGKIVQDFYCIYDFGYGPMNMFDLKIGDTFFADYNYASYRLVDLNKPSIDEGDWDTATSNSFEFYKGDNTPIAVNAAINSNQEDGGIVGQYQVVRLAPDTGDGADQEIAVIFNCPQGLTTYGTNGGRDTRSIELTVEFAQVGTEDWRAFNDETYVYSFSSVGDVSDGSTDAQGIVVYDPPVLYNTYISTYTAQIDINSPWPRDVMSTIVSWLEVKGLAKGATTFMSYVVVTVNTNMSYGGQIVGKISSRTSLGGGVYQYSLYAGLPFDIPISRRTKAVRSGYPTEYGPVTTAGAPFITEASSSGQLILKANNTTATYFSLTTKPKTTNQVKVRITRVRSYGGYSFRVYDNLTWSALNTRYDRVPIRTTKRHLFLEVKVQATDQLNGTIQNLSATVESVLPVYIDSTSTWELQSTRNPAWVYADILTSTANKRAISHSRLDTDSLLEWETYCDAIPTSPLSYNIMPRFESNFILDYKSTVGVLCNQVAIAAQASLNLIGGKYGVLIDRKKTTPVQVFTPRNSWGFSSTRNYADIPNALKIKYVDGQNNWAIAEEVVYATGYDASTALTFEEMDTFGCTDNEQAWRYGRYMMAQAILRQETISLQVDFENLVCTRGDYVLLQQDIMKVGGVPTRVKTAVGNVITIDEAFIDGGHSYGYTFRGVDGISTGTLVIDDSITATLTGDVPLVGDLLVWGIVDAITINCIVKSIVPNSDLTASLILVERANAIHDAESSLDSPTYDPSLTTAPDEFAPPEEVVDLTIDENTWECYGKQYRYYIDMSWTVPNNSAVDIYEIYVDYGAGYILAGYSSDTQYKYVVLTENLGNEHTVKVLALSSNGNKLSLAEVSEVSSTPLIKSTSPSDVDGLYLNVTNETLQIDWPLVSDCDVANYLIRFSPSLTASWHNSTLLQKVDATTSMCTVQARTGTYLVKAIDWNDTESTNEALAVTSIPELTGLNIITETDDFPTLSGVKDRVVNSGNALILQEESSGGMGVVEYYSEGFYYFSEILDLGEIYTVRLQSLIQAEGYSSDDLLSNWTSLADIDSLASATTGDWDVETYYRSTDQYITMDSWTTLDSVSALDAGADEVWSEWRKFTIGDFTGRIFQFKLKLISNKASITPRVIEGVIKADMPDRIERVDNITVPVTGYTLTYSVPFKGPNATPNIQVTQDNASTGDYWRITSKSLASCHIKFYDKTDTLVERQCDITVLGYGRKTSSVL